MVETAKKLLLWGVVALMALSGAASYAQDRGTGLRISAIRVDGAQRIEPDTVRAYMTVRIGDEINAVTLDESLKKLFATGLFADVVLRQEGSTIVIRVVENPIVNRIAFEGNKRIDNEILGSEIKLRPRVVLTRTRVQNDVQRITDIYRRTGRYAATIEPKVIQLSQNRVDLVFEIDEGPLTEIRRIVFIGNRRFSDSVLRKTIQTKESAWYRFLTSDDSYDPDRLTFDRELLRRHYLAKGYADFRVVSAIAEIAPDREGFFITFTVEEGERYKFGRIGIAASLRDLDSEKLRGDLLVKTGVVYNADLVEDTITKLTDAVGTFGYAFVEIRPRVKRNREIRTIDVTFNIQEGPRVYVERIDITGNLRTIDSVIRREFTLIEGDAFNTAKMRLSRRRIRNLGLFRKLDVKNVRGSAADKTVLKISVEEKSTGEISFGAGFSSAIGIVGDVAIRERNLLGRGQDLLLRAQLAAEASELELRFTEPHFLDRRLSGGFDLFRTTRDLQEESSYDRKSTGFGLRLGYSFTEQLSQRLRYALSREEVAGVASDASSAIKEQEGTTVKSLIGQVLTYDKRDNRFNPTEGYVVRLRNDLAGLGGSTRFLRNRLDGTHYTTIFEDMVVSVGGGGGLMFGFDGDILIIDRFFLGGNRLRGFKVFGAGPRDISTKDSVGGKWIYNGSAQLQFPLGLPNEFAMRGHIFSDFGSLGDTDSSGPDIRDSGSLRASTGIGISWISPVGPITIDFTQAILKEDFDRTETFRLNFGTRF